MIRCKQLYVICVMSWIVAMCANAHVESPSFKYSRHANEAAAQKNAPNQHTARDGQENDGASHHHALHEHHHHGHSHDHGHDCQHHHHDHGNEKPIPMHRKKEAPLDVTTLWVQAIGATLLISVAPFLILIFIPISGRTGHEDFLKTLLSFASGGLLGDAFLHLIPHAMSPHEHGQGENDLHEGHHGHSHSHGHHHDNTVGFCVLMGIFAFLIVEKFVRMVKGNHSHGDHGHGHSHSAKPSVTADPATDERTKLTKGSKKSSKETAGGDRTNRQQQGQEASDDSDSTKPCDGGSATQSSDIRVAAYLNLAADFAHNFTDGLAIGASFLAGNTAGIVSTVTILLHEVPHEIGDFAILVQSGMSKRKAMCMQLVTAIGCLSGTIVSLVAGGVGAAYWVLPFTAGGFIYIATVSVIPELLENTRFWQSVKEIIALILGVSMMMLLTEFENA